MKFGIRNSEFRITELYFSVGEKVVEEASAGDGWVDGEDALGAKLGDGCLVAGGVIFAGEDGEQGLSHKFEI